MRNLLFVAVWLITQTILAQDVDAYLTAIKTGGRGPAVRGFLHSVNDSAVVILPATLNRKGLEAALDHPRPVSIPIRVIKKLKLARLRSSGNVFLTGLLVTAGYSVAYILLLPPTQDPLQFLFYGVTVTAMSLLTLDLIYSKSYDTTRPDFYIKMQKYCLVQSGLMMHR